MDELLDAVASTYEAVLDPDVWPVALDKIARTCDGHSAILSFNDGNHGLALNGVFNRLSVIYDPAVTAAHLETYGEFEMAAVRKLFELSAQRPEYSVITDAEGYGGLEKFISHPVAEAAKQRFGFFRRAGVVLNLAEPWDDVLLVQFPAHLNTFPLGAFEKISTIAPYIARAMVASRPLAVLQTRYAMVLEALDRLAVGTAMLTGAGEIVIANRAFERLLEDGTTLFTDQSKILQARHEETSAYIKTTVANAARSGIGESLDTGQTFSLERPGDKDPLMVDVSPLALVDGLSSLRGYVIMYAIDPDWRLVTNPRSLGTAYGLTKTEQETCRQLLEGLTNHEIADLRNVSPETVKSHVANALSKTHSRNRTELAHRAAAADIPLLEDD